MIIKRKTTGKAYPPEWQTADGVTLHPGFIEPAPRSLDGYNLRFYCRWCRKWHIHGWGEDEEPGTVAHRVAHCYNDLSPMAGPSGAGSFILVTPIPYSKARKLFKAANESSRGVYRPPLEVRTEEDPLDEPLSGVRVRDNSHSRTVVDPNTLESVLLTAADPQ